ncbi:MAG: class I SAM-dependent methyltransferase [Euryarchaeota archaeon]|nr:class I SAM-dependent methyltransferase [Euryarchaeota archaeon]
MFDPREYDSWYDRHAELYEAELAALRMLTDKYPEPGLEIGVGTGRFASSLGFGYGIDPDENMLEYAARRGIKVKKGVGEAIPYPAGSFSRVLVVTAFPFFQNPERVAQECFRVLKFGGALIVGMVPRSSHFGQKYVALGQQGDLRLRDAHFYEVHELEHLLSQFFERGAVYSTLIGTPPDTAVVEGVHDDASFVAMEWLKSGKKF